MTRIFITGSADGLGRAAAETLIDGGHEVIVHARSTERLTAVQDLIDRGACSVVGDLADQKQTRGWPTRSTSSAGSTPWSTTPAS